MGSVPFGRRGSVGFVVVVGRKVDYCCWKTKHYGFETAVGFAVDFAAEVDGYMRSQVFAAIDFEVCSTRRTKVQSHAPSENYDGVNHPILDELGFVVDFLYEARLYAPQVLQCHPKG
jgi:hypothetical protein